MLCTNIFSYSHNVLYSFSNKIIKLIELSADAFNLNSCRSEILSFGQNLNLLRKEKKFFDHLLGSGFSSNLVNSSKFLVLLEISECASSKLIVHEMTFI